MMDCPLLQQSLCKVSSSNSIGDYPSVVMSKSYLYSVFSFRNKPPSKNDILMEPKMPRLARELFRTELELPNTTNKKKPKKKEKKKGHSARSCYTVIFYVQ